MADQGRGTRIGFLAMTFFIVGLAGVFATYAVPVPLARALHRETVLDQALATAHAADPHKALAALRTALGSSAKEVIDGTGPLAARVSRARAAMRVRFELEAHDVALNTRLLVIISTIMAAAFGAALIGFGRG